jgi:hypothetical protein
MPLAVVIESLQNSFHLTHFLDFSENYLSVVFSSKRIKNAAFEFAEF